MTSTLDCYTTLRAAFGEAWEPALTELVRSAGQLASWTGAAILAVGVIIGVLACKIMGAFQ